MSTEVTAVVLLHIVPGRTEEVAKAITEFSDYVKENEPDVINYTVFKETAGDAPLLVIVSSFKSQEVLEQHLGSDKLAKVKESIGDLLAAPPQEIFSTTVIGWSR